MMSLKWVWMNYPIGFPLEDRDDLGGERTGPRCALTMEYTDDDITKLCQSVMMNGLREDIPNLEKWKAKSLMLGWLSDQFGAKKDAP